MVIERLREIHDSLERIASRESSGLFNEASLIVEGAKILHQLHVSDRSQIENNPELKKLETYFLGKLSEYKKKPKSSSGRFLLTGGSMLGYNK